MERIALTKEKHEWKKIERSYLQLLMASMLIDPALKQSRRCLVSFIISIILS